MSAIDTNALVRYIVRDDAKQFDLVSRLIGLHSDLGEPIFVPVTVLLELEWVLRARFRFSKTQVLEAIDTLLSAKELLFESALAVRVALRAYRDCTADLADCLHLALATQAGERPMVTFDRRASRMRGARLLSDELLQEVQISARQTDAKSWTRRPPPVAAPLTAIPH